MAQCSAVARRRTNHGQSRPAGELAEHAIGTIVPKERLRLTRVQIAWPQIARGNLRRTAWPGALRDNTLFLRVRNNQWLHELNYMTAELLGRVQAMCPEAGVREVRLRVGDIPDPPPPSVPPPPPDIIDLSPEPDPATVDALQGVEDGDLRRAMANARMALSGRLRR